MFDHRLLATEGLFPGLVSHFSIAVRGEFAFEVIVRPNLQDWGYSDLEYQVVIRIKRKDKVWESVSYVSYFTGKSLEKVVASFKGIKSLGGKIGASVRFINTKIKTVFVKVKQHDTK